MIIIRPAAWANKNTQQQQKQQKSKQISPPNRKSALVPEGVCLAVIFLWGSWFPLCYNRTMVEIGLWGLGHWSVSKKLVKVPVLFAAAVRFQFSPLILSLLDGRINTHSENRMRVKGQGLSVLKSFVDM
ncbi:hypothetical protein CEXT_624401 [Caerostris extrusa]|uniref:Uncharacterized protein n=1 Tax=Caerostris extrusa TaxID=172846 RepID=A0AAV4TFA9_CAEEX|nr:hypothetical protein CEXT_624401 [Caerostris extrusa]